MGHPAGAWGDRWLGLAEGGVDFFVVVGGFEDFAGLGAVGGTDQAIALHHVDEVGGAAVADAQAALQQRGAGLAELEDEADCVVEEIVVFLAGFAVAVEFLAGVVLGPFEEAMDVLGLALGLPECGDRRDFFFGYKWRVDALDAAGAGRQVEHVSLA